ncbi:unnamed protein product, partial [Nezara viridula]
MPNHAPMTNREPNGSRTQLLVQHQTSYNTPIYPHF